MRHRRRAKHWLSTFRRVSQAWRRLRRFRRVRRDGKAWRIAVMRNWWRPLRLRWLLLHEWLVQLRRKVIRRESNRRLCVRHWWRVRRLCAGVRNRPVRGTARRITIRRRVTRMHWLLWRIGTMIHRWIRLMQRGRLDCRWPTWRFSFRRRISQILVRIGGERLCACRRNLRGSAWRLSCLRHWLRRTHARLIERVHVVGKEAPALHRRRSLRSLRNS